MTEVDFDRALTTEQAANLLALSPRTLEAWRSRGRKGPRFLRFGRTVRYRLSALIEWLDTRPSATCTQEQGAIDLPRRSNEE